MGIGFVLLFWAVIGAVVALVAAVVLGFATRFLTHGAQHGRSKAILAAVALPFFCLAWSGAVFIFQAVINETMLGRDAGLGDTWRCPLKNGYALLMIDVTDDGWIYNTKTQPGSVVTEQEDAVPGVRKAQVAGQYILGAWDSKWSGRLGENSDEVDGFFIIDTQTGKRTNLPNYEALSAEARRLGIDLALVSIYELYSQYRYSRFELLAGLLFLGPQLVMVYLLIRWIRQARLSRNLAAQPA